MTPFGKAVRHLRIEREMLLGQMADCLGITSAYASQIETGKRPIPAGYVERIINLYQLDAEKAQGLRNEAIQSTNSFNINIPADAQRADRVLASELATEFARLTPEAKSRILKIVKGER